MEQFFIVNQDIIIKLALSMTLGMVIGIERYIAHKTAGMRTYALLSMGSALFVVLSTYVINMNLGVTSMSMTPTAVMAAIITGIGFLGAGAMIKNESKLVGLTTATGLWVSAGIGMAVGFGLYSLSIITTVFVLFIFLILHVLETKVLDKISNNLQTKEKEKLE